MKEKRNEKENKIEKKGIVNKPHPDKPPKENKPTEDKPPKENKPKQGNSDKDNKN